MLFLKKKRCQKMRQKRAERCVQHLCKEIEPHIKGIRRQKRKRLRMNGKPSPSNERGSADKPVCIG